MTVAWAEVAAARLRPSDDSEVAGYLDGLQAGKQRQAGQLFVDADAAEIFYGGAAGGGKTEWLIRTAVLACVAAPGNRAVIFRRVFPSLRRSIEPRAKAHAKQWGATYNAGTHELSFPNGSVLELGHLQYEDTVHDYQGAEFGFIGFEEVTEFTAAQYEYMLSRLRSPVDAWTPRVAATGNPGGKGHAWVKARWVAPHGPDGENPEPGEVWAPDPTVVEPDPLPRVFLPATIEDNPILLERDPGYLARLEAIRNPGVRAALRHGDWDAIEIIPGALWSARRIEETRVLTAPPLDRIGVGVDPATSGKGDRTGIVTAGIATIDGETHLFVVADRTDPEPTVPSVWREAVATEYLERRADVIVAEKNRLGETVELVLRDAKALGGRPARIESVTARVSKETRADPIAAMFDDGRAHIVGHLPDLEAELTTWVPGQAKKGGKGKGSPDSMDALVHVSTHLLGLDAPVGGPDGAVVRSPPEGARAPARPTAARGRTRHAARGSTGRGPKPN